MGVGHSGSDSALEGFVDTFGVGGFVHVADPDRAIRNEYGVFTQPMFVFIDDDGTAQLALISVEELEDRIEALLDT